MPRPVGARRWSAPLPRAATGSATAAQAAGPAARRPAFLLLVTVAAAYAAGAWFSWAVLPAPSTAVFYPPAGVTLGALLLTGNRQWPWVLAVAGLVELTTDVVHGAPVPAALGFVAANVAEPLVGALLLRSVVPGPLRLDRRGDAGAFLLSAVLGGPLVGAVLGATVIAAGTDRTWLSTVLPYWAGDSLAVLSLGAAVASAGTAAPWRRRDAGLLAALVAATTGLTVVGFWSTEASFAYLPLVALVAAAFTGRVTVVATCSFAMVAAANTMSANGFGPWARFFSDADPQAGLLQLYLAGAVGTAWLLTVEIRRRDTAERLGERERSARVRLEILQGVTAGLARAETMDEVADVLVTATYHPLWDHTAVAVPDRSTGSWRVAVSESFGAQARRDLRPVRADSVDAPLTHAARRGEEVLVTSRAELAERFPAAVPAYEALGVGSTLAVPIPIAGRLRGGLALGWTDEQQPGDEALSLARSIADLAAQAIGRAERYEVEHRTGQELQQALLPVIEDHLPGVDVGAAYRPAAAGHAVGGDWYDVFELPGNRVGIAVGDVVGHDLHAAATMGAMQRRLRAAAVGGARPREVMEILDEAVADVPAALGTTVGYAEYVASDGTLTYACAGHLPPLLVGDGGSRYLMGGRSLPLGLALGPRPEDRVTLAPGTSLLWFSDGLVERRRGDIDTGLDAFAALARRLTDDDPQACVDDLLTRMLPGSEVEDDTVLVCVRTRPLTGADPSPVLRLTARALQDVGLVRRHVRRWAAAHGVAGERLHDLVLVCSEAVANAVAHGGVAADDDALVDVTVRAGVNGLVRLDVRDLGRWQPSDQPGTGERGRGLAIMSALSRQTNLEIRHDGTTLTAWLPKTG